MKTCLYECFAPLYNTEPDYLPFSDIAEVEARVMAVECTGSSVYLLDQSACTAGATSPPPLRDWTAVSTMRRSTVILQEGLQDLPVGMCNRL